MKVQALIRQQFFTDGGHGWLKVSKARLEKLNIMDKITGCSFMRGGFAYLEEDCDVSTYVRALLKQENVKEVEDAVTEEYRAFMKKFWELTTTNDTSCSDRNSVIRGYDRFVNYSEEEKEEKKDLITRLLNDRNWNKAGIKRINNGSLDNLKHWVKHYNA